MRRVFHRHGSILLVVVDQVYIHGVGSIKAPDGEVCRAICNIASPQDFCNALKIGQEQDLSVWSGDVSMGRPERWTPADFGEVIAINRGDDIEILHPRLFADRQRVWTGDSMLDAWREGRQHIRA